MGTSSNKMDSAEVFGMFEKIIERLNKQPEKSVEQVNQSVSKEEITAIVNDKINFIESKVKQLIENQTNVINKKLGTLSFSGNGSFAQPKKIAFFGFEFLRTSVVIFILSLIIFWSLVMNIKQMDNYQALKTKYNQLTEYIYQMQQDKKQEMKNKKFK